MNALAKIIATFFGAGFCPIAPGTAASFITALIYVFLLHGLAWPVQAFIIVAVFLIGVPAASRYSAELGRKDPGRVVIDEACGQLIALFMLPTRAPWPRPFCFSGSLISSNPIPSRSWRDSRAAGASWPTTWEPGWRRHLSSGSCS
jgi:phosphatidylglycerophosphatase A